MKKLDDLAKQVEELERNQYEEPEDRDYDYVEDIRDREDKKFDVDALIYNRLKSKLDSKRQPWRYPDYQRA